MYLGTSRLVFAEIWFLRVSVNSRGYVTIDVLQDDIILATIIILITITGRPLALRNLSLFFFLKVYSPYQYSRVSRWRFIAEEKSNDHSAC